METYKVKFQRIGVYSHIDDIRYRIILDKFIPGYKIDADGQVFKTTVNYIDILSSALIAQTIRCIPNLGIIHAYLVEKNLRETGKRIGINAAQLQAYLTDADVTLERTEFHPGEEYTTIDGEVCIHKFDGYTTNITDIVVTANAESIGDRVILDQDIPGYKMDTNGQIIRSTVNYIDIAPSALIAQTICCVPNLGIIHAYLVEKNLRGSGKRVGIDAAQLQAYLTDADVTLERTEFHPGEEYTTSDGEVRTHEFDGYTTTIKDIVVTANAERIVDRAIDRIMLGGI